MTVGPRRTAHRPGRDRLARLLPAPGGTRRADPSGAPHAAVVGGGIAGLTAATALAERGVRVTLYEREPQLGGRLAGWPTRLADGSTVTMSRGFHAFFRQYYNLRALLRRTDPALSRLTGFAKLIPCATRAVARQLRARPAHTAAEARSASSR
ncbi:dehydrogenase [Streptomyces viridochromogenes DSM 40736]|uniref:Dehydrogenase n=1 Tax=Streptomyces viridochromogenes (strain DSM 40736 / JCM 4977 / BCRC 1201 / Tue 494) TaxID=591159 RepID=D9X4J2_STRVT|nr:dehydrogenase [Streptomyces viridochromogenes DSM 40736]